jgi:membrane protease YdiL (CAAX protease family)
VSDSHAPPAASSSFGAVVVTTEAVLAVLAWILGRWSGIDWAMMIRPTADGVRVGLLGGLGLVTLHLVLVLPGGPRNPLYRRIYVPLRRMLRPWARSTSVITILGVALASGIAEELVFRGWLQTQTNVGVASLLFGTAHLWGRGALLYGAYAALMGVGLGGLFAYTGRHLWAPALAHVLNNLLGLLALRYGWPPIQD